MALQESARTGRDLSRSRLPRNHRGAVSERIRARASRIEVAQSCASFSGSRSIVFHCELDWTKRDSVCFIATRTSFQGNASLDPDRDQDTRDDRSRASIQALVPRAFSFRRSLPSNLGEGKSGRPEKTVRSLEWSVHRERL